MFHIDDLFHVILKGQSLDPTFLMQQPLPAMSKVTEFGNQLWDTSPVVSFSRKLDIPDVNWTSQMLDKKLLVTSPNWPRSDLQPFLKGSVWQSPGCPIRLIRPLWRVDGQTWTAMHSLLDLWCFMFSSNIGVRFSSNHLHLQEYKTIQDIFVNRGLWSCPKLLSGHAFRRPRFYLPSNTGVGHP